MINVNATYTNIINGGGHYEWRIQNGSNTFYKENIISGTITSSLYNGVSIGNALSSELKLTLWNATIDTTSNIVVEFRATNGSSNSNWYTKGVFFIDTVETSPYSEVTTVTAFDAMLKAETVYQESGEWTPTTADVIVQNIAGDMGLLVRPSTISILQSNPITLTEPINIGASGTTDRELLEYIGSIYGGNWVINNTGTMLSLALLSDAPVYTANVGDAVRQFDVSDTETIKRLRLIVSGGETYTFPPIPLETHTPEDITDHNNDPILAWASSYEEGWNDIGGLCLDVEIPFWGSYSIGENLYNTLVNTSYIPYKAQGAFVDPKYEIGDGITIKGVTSVIGNMETTIDLLSPCECYIEKTNILNSLYPYVTSKERSAQFNAWQAITLIGENTKQIQANTNAIANIPADIERAASLITGGYGGYVKWIYLTDGTPSELLFMDSPSESTATNILRFNKNGIGFSNDGGLTYANAWTIDGKLNADFISAGTISDASGENYWDLITGQFTTKQGTIAGYKIEQTQLSSGNYGEGDTGSTLAPSGIGFTYFNSVRNETNRAVYNAYGLGLSTAPSGGSFVRGYETMAGITPTGYGYARIYVDSTNSPHITLYDFDDAGQPNKVIIGGQTVFTDNVTAQSALNVTGAINGVYVATTLINSGSSKTFTVPSGSRHRVTVAGTVTARMAEIIVGCATNGTVGISALSQGSSISVTTGTNSLTIGTTGGSASIMITTFSGSPMTFS